MWKGLFLLKPTSVTTTGTGSSATIGTNGSVTFSAVESLSLNGVFSADYENYIIAYRGHADGTANYIHFRYRSSGTDNTTASSYTQQWAYNASGTRFSDTYGFSNYMTELPARHGFIQYVYGPFLADFTTSRTLGASGVNSMYDAITTHSQQTSFDGITLISYVGISGRPSTGRLAVYGLRK